VVNGAGRMQPWTLIARDVERDPQQ
jgi:hypothetical protein